MNPPPDGPSDAMIWAVIVALGVVTFLIRFSFLGLIGDRQMPRTVRRALDFVPVTVLPALVAPALFRGDDGTLALVPSHLIPAVVVLTVGAWSGKLMTGLGAGLAVFLAMSAVGL